MIPLEHQAEFREVIAANRRAHLAYLVQPSTALRPKCRRCATRTEHPSGFCRAHRPDPQMSTK